MKKLREQYNEFLEDKKKEANKSYCDWLEDEMHFARVRMWILFFLGIMVGFIFGLLTATAII